MKIDDVFIDNQIIFDATTHTTILSFNCDIQNEYFQMWWETKGKEMFIKYYNGKED